MEHNPSADVVIVGGGIIGVAIAYYLAQRRYGRIVVVERNSLGMGSTGRSVASIEPLALFPGMAALQQRSFSVYQHFDELIGGECGFVQLPVAIFFGANELVALHQALSTARQTGMDVSEITPEDFLREEPGMCLDDIASVYCSPHAGYADPMLTLNGFADAARALGVTIRQNTPVLGVRVEKNRVTGVEIPGGVIDTPTVVLASGLWSGGLLEKLGIPCPIQLRRHFVVVLEAPPTAPRHSILDSPYYFYTRPEKTGGLYLMGSTTFHDNFDKVSDPDEDDPTVSDNITFDTWERVVKRFPVMEEARLKNTYTGIADMTPDAQPLLGALPIDGLLMAAGMSGVGFKMAPGVGQVMAGLIAGDADCAALLAPLRPSRVDEGALMHPPGDFSLLT